MAQITSEEFIHALKEAGIEMSDLVFVHSDLRPFGLPHNCSDEEEILQFYYKAFIHLLGPLGTLAVPAFFYEYARLGESFDVDTSPVSASLGVFSRFINQHRDRVRSLNPLQSIAALGKKAKSLCGAESLAGYGVTSPWHRLRKLRGKILFLGTSLQPMTFVHHIEQQYGVPHLYTKVFEYPVLKKGLIIKGTVTSSVRYLNYDIEYDLRPFQNELAQQGVLRFAQLNGAPIFSVTAEDAFSVGINMLKQNPYYFLRKNPSFVAGKIPMDGMTGNRP